MQHTFAELIADPSLLGQYDMVVSGFAIHHLYLAEKVGPLRPDLPASEARRRVCQHRHRLPDTRSRR